MGSEQQIMGIEEVRPGETTIVMRKIAPDSGADFTARLRTPIAERNPLTPVKAEQSEVDGEISLDVIEAIFYERQRVYRIVMQSGKQYRIWIQQSS